MTQPRADTQLTFGPDRRLTAALALATLVGLVVTLTATDGAGRLLFAGATLLLAAYTVADLVFATRLRADRAGLRIRTPLVRADLSWAEVENVRADARMRYGLRSTTFEIDAGAVLVVFSRRSLGADPETVRELITALRPSS